MKTPRAKAVAKPKVRKPGAKRSATPAARKAGSVMTGAPVPAFGWPPDEDRVEDIFARLSRV
ncbi:MAG: endonuclease III, partial [Phenylobacterium zucineum]